MTNEIVPWSESRRDGARPFKGCHHDCNTPARPGQGWRRHTHLVDLEPSYTGTIAGTKRTSALVHPDHDRALLVSPLGPDGRDCLPSRDISAEGSAGAAVAGHGGA